MFWTNAAKIKLKFHLVYACLMRNQMKQRGQPSIRSGIAIAAIQIMTIHATKKCN